MKTSIVLFVVATAICSTGVADHIAVKITDKNGKQVANADVVAVLKSGAYQDAKLDATDGLYKCEPTEECVKIFVAAPGYEAASPRYSGNAGALTVALTPSAEKDSAIVRGRSRFPNIDGEIGLRWNPPTNRFSIFVGRSRFSTTESRASR
jgi:hypothetical protein